MATRIEVTEQLVRSFEMIDGDLELALKEIGMTSPPDEVLPVCSFKMIHRSSGVEMGALSLRVGYTENVVQYCGNIGYTVLKEYRRNDYASRSCWLLVPLLRWIKLSPIWITCNPNNVPSRKSIEKVGATFVDQISMPASYKHVRFYSLEARQKLRFRWDVN